MKKFVLISSLTLFSCTQAINQNVQVQQTDKVIEQLLKEGVLQKPPTPSITPIPSRVTPNILPSKPMPTPIVSIQKPINPNIPSIVVEVRLVLNEPEPYIRPTRLFAVSPEDSPEEVKILKPGQSIILDQNSFWGVLIKTNYSGTSKIKSSVSLKEFNDPQKIFYTWNSYLGESVVNADGSRFTMGSIHFSTNNIVNLFPLAKGSYILTLTLAQPDTENIEQLEYILQVKT